MEAETMKEHYLWVCPGVCVSLYISCDFMMALFFPICFVLIWFICFYFILRKKVELKEGREGRRGGQETRRERKKGRREGMDMDRWGGSGKSWGRGNCNQNIFYKKVFSINKKKNIEAHHK